MKHNMQIMVDYLGVEYIQPCHIRDKFDLSRTTVHRLLEKMRADPRYRASFIRLTYRLSLVNLADFRKFLFEQDRQYLQEAEEEYENLGI